METTLCNNMLIHRQENNVAAANMDSNLDFRPF